MVINLTTSPLECTSTDVFRPKTIADGLRGQWSYKKVMSHPKNGGDHGSIIVSMQKNWVFQWLVGRNHPRAGKKKKKSIWHIICLPDIFTWFVWVFLKPWVAMAWMIPQGPLMTSEAPPNLRVAPTNCSTPYNHKMSIEERGLFALHVAVAILTQIGEH